MRNFRRKSQTVVDVTARIVIVMLFIAVSGSAFAVSPILKEMEDAFVRLGEEVRPCVVNIDAEGTASSPHGSNMQDLFKFFDMQGPKGPPKKNQMRTKATGSGFIYDKEGHIVTNNHVVADTDELTVRLWNGKEYKAKVIGTDPETDLAVIKIDADEDLPVAQLGDSDNLIRDIHFSTDFKIPASDTMGVTGYVRMFRAKLQQPFSQLRGHTGCFD